MIGFIKLESQKVVDVCNLWLKNHKHSEEKHIIKKRWFRKPVTIYIGGNIRKEVQKIKSSALDSISFGDNYIYLNIDKWCEIVND